MILTVSSDIVPNYFGLLAEVTAPESHHLAGLEHPLNQGCTLRENILKQKLVGMTI